MSVRRDVDGVTQTDNERVTYAAIGRSTDGNDHRLPQHGRSARSLFTEAVQSTGARQVETSAPVQERPHGSAQAPTRRQRQAELRAQEVASAGLPGHLNPEPLNLVHHRSATVRTAPPIVEQAAPFSRETASQNPAPLPSLRDQNIVRPAAAARAASLVATAPPFPPTGIQRTVEPVAPLRTPSGEIPVALVAAPTPLRSVPTPVVAAPAEAAAEAAPVVGEPLFAPVTRRERKAGPPAPAPAAAPSTPARGTLFGSRLVARAATGAAFVGALACVPMIIPGTAAGDLAPGGLADQADDGQDATLASPENTAESQLLERAQHLVNRAEGPDSSKAVDPYELEAAKAELLALSESMIAERSQSSSRASRSNERTPLTDGAVAVSADEAAAQEAAGPATAADVARAADRVAILLQDYGETAASVVTPAPATPAELAAERRVRAQTLLAQCGSAKFSNGKIPASALTSLSFARGQALRCDAASMLEELSQAYQQRFGVPIGVTDTYRSYSEQVSTRAAKPGLAAVPGTSNHGWGLAIDLTAPASNPGSAQYKWLRANAPLYGWDNPAWARTNGSKPEPWHFEYTSGW